MRIPLQASLRDARFPFLSPTVTSSPGAGEVGPLGGAFGNAANFTAFRKAVPLGKVDASETSRRKGCIFMHHNIRRTTG